MKLENQTVNSRKIREKVLKMKHFVVGIFQLIVMVVTYLNNNVVLCNGKSVKNQNVSKTEEKDKQNNLEIISDKARENRNSINFRKSWEKMLENERKLLTSQESIAATNSDSSDLQWKMDTLSKENLSTNKQQGCNLKSILKINEIGSWKIKKNVKFKFKGGDN
jgi:hypothetical protein